MGELLWERGYAATSPRDVLARAEVGQGSMYHYFSGKHELAVETLQDMAADVTQESSLLNGEGSPLERIQNHLLKPRQGVRGCRIGRMTQDPQVVEDTEMIAIISDAFETICNRWTQAVAEAVAAGELPENTIPHDLARTLVSVIQGGFVLARAQGSNEPMNAAVRGAVALLDAAKSGTSTSD